MVGLSWTILSDIPAVSVHGARALWHPAAACASSGPGSQGHTGRAKTQSHALLDNHFKRRLGCLAVRLLQAEAVIKQVVILSLVPGKDKWLLCTALPPHSALLCNAQPCLLSSEELSLETQSAQRWSKLLHWGSLWSRSAFRLLFLTLRMYPDRPRSSPQGPAQQWRVLNNKRATLHSLLGSPLANVLTLASNALHQQKQWSTLYTSRDPHVLQKQQPFKNRDKTNKRGVRQSESRMNHL